MLLMIALLITSIPINTQASTKVSSGSKNTVAGDGHWGSSYKRTGWLVYYLHAHAPTDAGVTHAGR